MIYRFHSFKYLADRQGFNYPIDVSYGTVYIGTIIAEPDGFIIKFVDTPTGKQFINKDSKKNKFKSQNHAAEVLHNTWKILRQNGNEPIIAEYSTIENDPLPSKKMNNAAVLLIPDYENNNDKYPGDIKPGYYNRPQLLNLIIANRENPEALYFIADMLDTGSEDNTEFVSDLREATKNPKLLKKFILDLIKYQL